MQTEYGPVQVQITVAGGKITAADAVQYPTAQRRDVQINRQAVPMLNAEVLAAQSATIDAVSGASYTSDGYVQSLQAALDLAHQ
ncbi:MAG: FMN-binding protein [Actinomycetota bacterium]|nr:FMN-binding protein [Actinomycetota bacterium]